jgi:hypothetical protein
MNNYNRTIKVGNLTQQPLHNIDKVRKFYG